MDPDYWKDRCEAAEAALQRARSALQLPPTRRAAIAALGELKGDQAAPTSQLATKLRWTRSRVLYVMSSLERVGLVDRANTGRCGGRTHQVLWRLGHMVQVDPE